MAAPGPSAVLFACNRNLVRSPMAQGLLRLMFGDRIYAESCGLRADHDQPPDPFAVAVMDELGVDLTGHQPRSFDDLEDGSFDLVVSFIPEAHHRAVELARHRAVDVEYWPMHDPTLVDGSREEVLTAYREVRDTLARRIRERFGAAVTFGG